MRKFIRIASFLMVMFTGLNQAKAQSMIVKTGVNESTITTSTVQKFTFESSNLLQKNTDGTMVSYSLSSQTRIIFKSEATSTGSISLNNKFSFYPNPVTETIYFNNIPEQNTTVSICRIDGKLILQKEVSANSNSIDVSDLQGGLYLLKINNQTLKLIKQ